MDITEAVAAVLRGEMEAQRITWREMSARSGVPERTLARILKPEREIKLDVVYAISDVLGLAPSYIVGRAEEMMGRPATAGRTRRLDHPQPESVSSQPPAPGRPQSR